MKKYFTWFAGISVSLISSVALAQGAGADGAGMSLGLKAALALAAGLGIGISSFGGALAQGKAAAAALEGIARNPEAAGKVMTPLILSLALIESLVIYALVISFMLIGKL